MINQKLKAALGLLIVFGLVLSTNLLDKRYFSELQESFNSVYEDRLVAENYLFNISNQLQLKKMLLNEDTEAFRLRNASINATLEEIIVGYEATKLTEDEATYFALLKEKVAALITVEKSLLSTESPMDHGVIAEVNAQIQRIQPDLQALSEIQLIEGKRLIDHSQQIVSTSKLTSRLEVAVLIVVGLIIQVLILSSKPTTPRFDQKSNLN